jgi:hypothetical protein
MWTLIFGEGIHSGPSGDVFIAASVLQTLTQTSAHSRICPIAHPLCPIAHDYALLLTHYALLLMIMPYCSQLCPIALTICSIAFAFAFALAGWGEQMRSTT